MRSIPIWPRTSAPTSASGISRYTYLVATRSWVIGDREVAGRGQSECMFGVHGATEGGVDELIERAHQGAVKKVRICVTSWAVGRHRGSWTR